MSALQWRRCAFCAPARVPRAALTRARPPARASARARASGDSSVTSGYDPTFLTSVLHSAAVLLVPVGLVACVLLYCASGPDRWSTAQNKTGETRPLVRACVRARRRERGRRRASRRRAPRRGRTRNAPSARLCEPRLCARARRAHVRGEQQQSRHATRVRGAGARVTRHRRRRVAAPRCAVTSHSAQPLFSLASPPDDSCRGTPSPRSQDRTRRRRRACSWR